MSFEIEKLEGMDDEILEMLLKDGITTIGKLATYDQSILLKNGIPYKKLKILMNSVKNYMSSQTKFVTDDELTATFKSRLILKTLQPMFDGILDGGFETQKLWEIYGAPGSGKTTLLHQLMCRAALPVKNGGFNSKSSIFLDCENALSLKRLESMAPFWGIDYANIEKKLIQVPLKTVDDLLYFVENDLLELVKETGAKLIVLDSVATHFRSEFGNEKQLFERSTKMGRVAHAFRNISVKFNSLVIATNQKSGDKFYGGNTWGHEVQGRLRIKSDGDKIRSIMVEKAVDLENQSCELIMTEWGLLGKEVFKWKRDNVALTMKDILQYSAH